MPCVKDGWMCRAVILATQPMFVLLGWSQCLLVTALPLLTQLWDCASEFSLTAPTFSKLSHLLNKGDDDNAFLPFLPISGALLPSLEGSSSFYLWVNHPSHKSHKKKRGTKAANPHHIERVTPQNLPRMSGLHCARNQTFREKRICCTQGSDTGHGAGRQRPAWPHFSGCGAEQSRKGEQSRAERRGLRVRKRFQQLTAMTQLFNSTTSAKAMFLKLQLPDKT